MRRHLHVRRGDTVEVVAGNARGVRGRILRAMPQKERVVVEGVNLVWKHVGRSRQHPQGGRIQIEAPIHVSNVMLVCPNRDCAGYDKPVRAKSVARGEETRIRACAKCGAEIPKAE